MDTDYVIVRVVFVVVVIIVRFRVPAELRRSRLIRSAWPASLLQSPAEYSGYPRIFLVPRKTSRGHNGCMKSLNTC